MCEDLLRNQKDFLPSQAKTFSTENSKARGKILKKRNETNISAESLRLYERCKVAGCVTETLRIPDRFNLTTLMKRE